LRILILCSANRTAYGMVNGAAGRLRLNLKAGLSTRQSTIANTVGLIHGCPFGLDNLIL
jgi:hypothetical protein